jgi:hypothetical protein
MSKLSRSIIFGSCVALLSALLFVGSASFSQEVTDLKSPEDVENRIKGKITGNLDLFMKPQDYRVFASAKILKYREKVVLEGESESKSSGEEKQAEPKSTLPGFKKVDEPQPSVKNVNVQEKSKFAFHDRSKLTEVGVRLVLDQALPQNTKDLAIKTAKEAVDQTVGSVGVFEMVELDLAKLQQSDSAWGWFVNYMQARGGSAIDLLYLALLLLGSLGAIFALRHFYRSKKALKEAGSNLTPTKQSETKEQDKIDELCSQKMDEIIQLLNSSPLITRNFLKALGEKEKHFILHAQKTPALQSFFKKILGVTHLHGNEKNTATAVTTFETILTDLKRYISLNQEMVQKPFGYLPQLTGSQIANFVASEARPIETVKVLAPYLLPIHVQGINHVLSIKEKAEVIECLQFKGQGSSRLTSTELSSMETMRAQVDAALRLRYEAYKLESVVDMAEGDTLQTAFLDSDRDCVEVIKQLATKYGKVPTVYEKYLVSFEDFLGLDLGIAKKVLQRVSNEVLTQALADRELDARIVDLLGELRSQLIVSMKKRTEGVTIKDIENARNEVLRLYRAMA